MMRKFLFIFFLIALCSCRNEFDADLRGRWQLRTEALGDTEFKVDTIFYSFDGRVVDVQRKISEFEYSQQFGRVTHIGDSLILDFVDDNPPVKDRFKIEVLNSKTLRLRDSQRVLSFRKF